MCMLRQGCSLRMLHRTCENVHGVLGWVGLGMPNILHLPFYFKPRGIKKYSIPYMVQIELTYIFIKGGVVNSNVDGSLIVLAMPCPSLPIICKLSYVVVLPVL